MTKRFLTLLGLGVVSAVVFSGCSSIDKTDKVAVAKEACKANNNEDLDAYVSLSYSEVQDTLKRMGMNWTKGVDCSNVEFKQERNNVIALFDVNDNTKFGLELIKNENGEYGVLHAFSGMPQ